ncbi:MAG: phage terminase large subunit, partial [Proteobacteria bacterium]|nr:phage terminase large subunit [Pseudomonadota bacterium]
EIGDLAFETQYQQRPGCPGGNIVDLSWFERYDELPPIEPGDVIMQSWDIAITDNAQSNFSVCSTWLYKDRRLYLMDVWRKKMIYPDLRDAVPQYADIKKADVVIIEVAGAGMNLFQELRRKDLRRYLASEPKQSKEIRLMTLSHYVKQGRVWIPHQAPWLDGFLNELRNFPNGKYDDQVDSFSQALKWLQYTELRTRAA